MKASGATLGAFTALALIPACTHAAPERHLEHLLLEPAYPIEAEIYDVGDPVDGLELPEILNRPRVERALIELYPRSLLYAGRGGVVRTELILDPQGIQVAVRLHESSGHPELDAAGVGVARRMVFTPARLHGEPVYARLVIPTIFRSR